jgi:hypothetical protein
MNEREHDYSEFKDELKDRMESANNEYTDGMLLKIASVPVFLGSAYLLHKVTGYLPTSDELTDQLSVLAGIGTGAVLFIKGQEKTSLADEEIYRCKEHLKKLP